MLESIASRRMVGMNNSGVIVIVVSNTLMCRGPSPNKPAADAVTASAGSPLCEPIIAKQSSKACLISVVM